MRTLSGKHHLQKRGDTWYYNRRVPKVLVQKIGKAVVKQSLQTADLKEAKKKRNALDVAWDAKFAAAERNPSATNSAAPLSLEELVEHLRRYIEDLNDRGEKSLFNNPPSSETEREEMVRDAEIGIQVMSSRDDPNAESSISWAAKHVLESAGVESISQEVAVVFMEHVRRGLIELGV